MNAWDGWITMSGYTLSVVFNTNGSITETLKATSGGAVYATKTTTFNSNSSITEAVARSGANQTITTTFNSDGSVTVAKA
jgi:hypothetical protein